MHYRGQKVAVLGYGIEGKAAFDYWTKHGAEVTVHDAKSDLELPPDAKAVLGSGYLKNLNGYDLLIRSPGVFPYQFTTKTPITSVINEFLDRCPATVIGVTGSMGKGTTSGLIHHILTTAGKTAYLGGNIGEPPLEFLPKLKDSDYVVLEMSNVQLWDIRRSPQIAVLLMIAPEHMDWHRGNVNEYVATKANITQFQGSGDLLVYHAHNSYTKQIAAGSHAQKRPYLDKQGAYIEQSAVRFKDQVICKTSDVPLLGQHNLENVCAAVTATWDLVKDKAKIGQAIKAYKPLEHRLELVARVSGVEYYDDSIATHELAAIAAIEAFEQPKVLILGGSDKGADFKQIAKAVAEHDVREVILLGETTDKLRATLVAAGVPAVRLITGITQMAEVVKTAAKLAQAGDVVLLSPATASFGLFRDYKDRGDQFKAAVKALT